MRVGDVLYTKSITSRHVVEVTEGKNGKQRVRANTVTFAFQPEDSLLSKVGVFLFLGTFSEANGADKIFAFAEDQLRRLGWTSEGPRADDAVDPVGELAQRDPTTRDET